MTGKTRYDYFMDSSGTFHYLYARDEAEIKNDIKEHAKKDAFVAAFLSQCAIHNPSTSRIILTLLQERDNWKMQYEHSRDSFTVRLDENSTKDMDEM